MCATVFYMENTETGGQNVGKVRCLDRGQEELIVGKYIRETERQLPENEVREPIDTLPQESGQRQQAEQSTRIENSSRRMGKAYPVMGILGILVMMSCILIKSHKLLIQGSIAGIIIIGVVMVIMPKAAGKKSLTETKKGVLTVRIAGAALAVAGLLALLLLSNMEALIETFVTGSFFS